jgi:iron transport multicopper oxidase
LTTGKDAVNPKVYGDHVNPYILRKGQIVQIVVNNLDSGGHPMHIHGHNAQVLYRSDQPWNNQTSGFPQVPMRRDTIKVGAGGSLVLRFKADNPGVFLFHCHIEWHVEAGLTITLIEEPLALQNSGLSIPDDHLAVCKTMGIPTQGNCAGNTRNVLDNSQCNKDFDPNPVGAYVAPNKRRAVRRAATRQPIPVLAN